MLISNDNNLKDSGSVANKDIDSGNPLKSYMSIKKANKLVTALYMVTDIIREDEPLRIRLRTLAMNLLSDIHRFDVLKRVAVMSFIEEILSILSVAKDLRMVSEMNFSILEKEFINLRSSINNYFDTDGNWIKNLVQGGETDSTAVDDKDQKANSFNLLENKNKFVSNGHRSTIFISKGHKTNIGVQRGSTLLKALDSISMSNSKEDFEKKRLHRRNFILDIIKRNPNGVSVKDIMVYVRNGHEDMGDKTLQRELVGMVSDNLIYKTGTKRWSIYFAK